jgi:hypothetical protein
VKTKSPCAIDWYSDMQTSLPIYDMKASNEFDSPIKNKYVPTDYMTMKKTIMECELKRRI